MRPPERTPRRSKLLTFDFRAEGSHVRSTSGEKTQDLELQGRIEVLLPSPEFQQTTRRSEFQETDPEEGSSIWDGPRDRSFRTATREHRLQAQGTLSRHWLCIDIPQTLMFIDTISM